MKQLYVLLFCCLVCAFGAALAADTDDSTPESVHETLPEPAPAPESESQASIIAPEPELDITSAKEAPTMPNKTRMTLRGKISQHLFVDRFLFTDASGDIRLSISDAVWQDLTISDDDTVEIYGKLAKEANEAQIIVERIVKIP